MGAEKLAGTDPVSFGKLLSFIKAELVPKYSASYIKDQLQKEIWAKPEFCSPDEEGK